MTAQPAAARTLPSTTIIPARHPLLRLVVWPAVATSNSTCDDEITELAATLCEDDGLGMLEAVCQAADMLDELDVYAAGWDSMAFLSGNRAAMAF